MTTPIPACFNPDEIETIRQVPYWAIAAAAKNYATTYRIPPASADTYRVCLLAIDVQNTFCLPGFELFVGGRSGTDAVDDTRRLCEFIYQNLDTITEIVPTMDTHSATQIFHPLFWVNQAGEHPEPMTTISSDAVRAGDWRISPNAISSLAKRTNSLGIKSLETASSETVPLEIVSSETASDLGVFALHYAEQLAKSGKYPLTIWPYHSMLGGIGHALVPAFEEACFFHTVARAHQTRFELKGDNPLTENYSVLSPEVLTGQRAQPIAQKNNRLTQHLLSFDAVIIAGQAKSHCVAWTIRDLLSEIEAVDPSFSQNLAQKIYLLEDCTSPVVIPDVVDFTGSADATYQSFAERGVNLVKTKESIKKWPLFGK